MFFCILCAIFFKIRASDQWIIIRYVFIRVFTELFHYFIWCYIPWHILFLFVVNQLYLSTCSKSLKRPCWINSRINYWRWGYCFSLIKDLIFNSCEIIIFVLLSFFQSLRFSQHHFGTFRTLWCDYLSGLIDYLRVDPHKIWLLSIEEILKGDYFVSCSLQSSLEVELVHSERVLTLLKSLNCISILNRNVQSHVEKGRIWILFCNNFFLWRESYCLEFPHLKFNLYLSWLSK